MKKFYQIDLQPEKQSADIIIYGQIRSWKFSDSDVDAFSIINEINALDVDDINVYINSPGGEVGEAVAIYTALQRHKAKVTTYCDGFACSAASVIFCAGDERIIGKLAMLMIHNCMSYVGCANSDELRKIADDNDKINQASIEAYKSVCSIDENKIKELMDAETWLTADEAIGYGFATQIADNSSNNAEPQQSAMMSIRKAVLNFQNGLGLEERLAQAINKIEAITKSFYPKKVKHKPQTNDLIQSFVDFLNYQKQGD